MFHFFPVLLSRNDKNSVSFLRLLPTYVMSSHCCKIMLFPIQDFFLTWTVCLIWSPWFSIRRKHEHTPLFSPPPKNAQAKKGPYCWIRGTEPAAWSCACNLGLGLHDSETLQQHAALHHFHRKRGKFIQDFFREASGRRLQLNYRIMYWRERFGKHFIWLEIL